VPASNLNKGNPTRSRLKKRSRLLEQRIRDLKLERKRKVNKNSDCLPTHLHPSHQLRRAIKIKQRPEIIETTTSTTIKASRDTQTSPTSLTNNTQSYTFNEAVAQPPHTRKTTHQINVIMDTGATFTMLPGSYDFAWTNRSPCLHIIEGCFKGGGTNKDTEMGEMHALITLDNGEVR
jgi:hypothetical protein